MIITVTLNPTIDKALEAPGFRVGQHARVRLAALLPAGKGVNVARGVALLGGEAVACGLVGRGEESTYRDSLERDGVACAFTPVEGVTRSNTTILDPVGGTTTHLREEGFQVGPDDVARLRARLAGVIAGCQMGGEGAVVVFAGSLPPGLRIDDWVALLEQCREAGSSVVVDTSGDALRSAVDSGSADTVKPNLTELGQCLGAEVGRAEAPGRAGELLTKVRTVLLTLGEEGAYAVRRDGSEGAACRLAADEVRNTVGCGDAFLAGWLHGFRTTGDASQALRWAVATGAASARSESTVGYTRHDVEHLLPRCTAIGKG